MKQNTVSRLNFGATFRVEDSENELNAAHHTFILKEDFFQHHSKDLGNMDA